MIGHQRQDDRARQQCPDGTGGGRECPSERDGRLAPLPRLGAGLARVMAEAEVEVVEVNRPNRQLRLGAFMRPVSIHTAAWRYPGVSPEKDPIPAEIWREIEAETGAGPETVPNDSFPL